MFGFGHSSARRRGTLANGTVTPAPALIVPSGTWNGTAGTGFAVAPTDPVRVNAKPAFHMIVPPNQFYTDTLLVGVIGGTHSPTGDYSKNGIAAMRFHYEGTVIDVTSPSFQTFPDANGVNRTYFGWWVRLGRMTLVGEARLFVEAIAEEAAQQTRVLGPFSFSIANQLHDFSVVVAPTQPVVAGVSYQSIAAALTFLRTSAAQNPLITITETGLYNISSAGVYTSARGYCTITASNGVTATIGRPAQVTSGIEHMRPQYDGLRFKGAGIVFDFTNFTEIWHEGGGPRHWADGCKIFRSGGRNALYRGGLVSTGIFRNPGYFTEVAWSEHKGPEQALLVRGGTYDNTFGDLFSGVRCNIGSRSNDHSSEWYRLEAPAFSMTSTVDYTFARTNVSSTVERFTLTVGGTAYTFDANNTQAGWVANTNYTAANIVTWINSLAVGVTATLIDNERRIIGARPLGEPSDNNWTRTVTAGSTLQIVVKFALHSDWAQFSAQNGENYVMHSVLGRKIIAQHIFATDDTKLDFFFANVLTERTPSSDAAFQSQFSRVQSNVTVVNCTIDQTVTLKTDTSYNPDARCSFISCASDRINWGAAPDADLKLIDNHQDGAFALPVGSVGGSIGGTYESWYPGAATGDFTPAGDLLANLKPRRSLHDYKGDARPDPAPAGAATRQ